MVGKTISHYKIVEKLGQGGMGIVYKAQDTTLGRFVALKFLPHHLAADDEQTARFLTEAKAASAIDHPNIGAIFETAGTDDGQLFIAMAYYDGGTLRERIRKGQLTIDESVSIAKQIATGLSAAHEAGIIHRDLKPENILFTHDGIPKIIDFGLAKLSGGVQLTRTGTSVGTAAYMSPEQARGDSLAPNTDVWSLSVILYEMLTGVRPFRGEFETALMYSIVNEDPEPITTHRADVPPSLWRTIQKGLEKDPSKRYQSVNEFLTAIAVTEGGTSEVGMDRSTGELATKLFANIFLNHRPKVLILIGAILVLGAGAITYIYFHGGTQSSSHGVTIAVLPFINRGNPEQDYYADGLTADIAKGLSMLPTTFVISRSSSARYRDSRESPREIGKALGVHFLVKGEMQLLPARLKLDISLIDADQGKEMWSQEYEGQPGEILSIKAKAVGNLADRLSIDTKSVRPPSGTINADAYDSYLHGVYYRDRFNKDDNLLAMSYFSNAVRADSTFVLGLEGLADAKIEPYLQGWDFSESNLDDATLICTKLLKLDSVNSQALAMLGSISNARGKVQDGLALLHRSLDIDHRNSYALTEAAVTYLFRLNDPVQAIVLLKKLEEVDPEDWLVTSNLGVAYAQLKKDDQAIQSLRRAVVLDPLQYMPVLNLGNEFERTHQYDSAVLYYSRAIGVQPKAEQPYEYIAEIQIIRGNIAPAESILQAGIRALQSAPELFYALGVTYQRWNKRMEAKTTLSEGLQLLQSKMGKEGGSAEYTAEQGLFQARLGEAAGASASAEKAFSMDSTDDEVLIRIAGVHSILGNKRRMLRCSNAPRGEVLNMMPTTCQRPLILNAIGPIPIFSCSPVSNTKSTSVAGSFSSFAGEVSPVLQHVQLPQIPAARMKKRGDGKFAGDTETFLQVLQLREFLSNLWVDNRLKA